MLTVLDTENADRNLSSEVQVLADTPTIDSGKAKLVRAYVELGDGTKDLTGAGGNFTLRITVGGVTVLGGGITYALAANARATIQSDAFIVPQGDEVRLYVTSPNGGDTDVDVTAYLIDVAVDQSNLTGVQLADDAITSAKFDESTAFPLRANTLNLAMDSVITGATASGTLTTTTFTTNLTGFDNDRLIGRCLTFTSGPLDGETVDIEDYSSTNGTLTVTLLTEAPTAGNTFTIT